MKKKKKTQLESIGKKKIYELNDSWMLSPGLRTTVPYVAQVSRLPAKALEATTEAGLPPVYVPFPATKKRG